MERAQVLIIDASVAVKWYVKEQMRDKALKLRDDYISERIDLQAPSLILYEVGNAIRYHPGSTGVECAEAVRGLRMLGLTIHELDENLIDIASNLAFSKKITFYDAVYVALAKNLQGTFITADEELLRQLGEETKKDAMLLIDYG